MINLTPTVRILLIINVLVFVLQGMLPNLWPQLALYPFGSSYFQPFQLVTYMFLHAGWNHLFSNMFGLFMFGPLLEQHVFGANRFLIFYFVTAIGGAIGFQLFNMYEVSQLADQSLVQQLQNIPTVGASGAIFGIIAAFGLIFPNLEMQLFLIPFPIKAKYFVTIYALFELYSGIARPNSGIAHFAHLGGMVLAFVLLQMWHIKRRY